MSLASRALDLEEVRHAHFTENRLTGAVSGVVGTRSVEFDVRKDGRTWNVNDDESRNYRSRSLKRALRKAIAAQIDRED